MGYQRRDMARIKMGICIGCKIKSAASPSPRCRECGERASARERRRYRKKARTAAAKIRAKLRAGRISYTTLHERRERPVDAFTAWMQKLERRNRYHMNHTPPPMRSAAWPD
jgi:hypothetical protein